MNGYPLFGQMSPNSMMGEFLCEENGEDLLLECIQQTVKFGECIGVGMYFL